MANVVPEPIRSAGSCLWLRDGPGPTHCSGPIGRVNCSPPSVAMHAAGEHMLLKKRYKLCNGASVDHALQTRKVTSTTRWKEAG